MKTHLVFATLFLTSLAAFGAHTQPSPSSQFRRNHSRQTSKASRKTVPHANGGAAARPATMGKTTGTNPAAKGRFVNRPATFEHRDRGEPGGWGAVSAVRRG